MFRFGLILISLTICASVISADIFPDDIKRCEYSDNECISATITDILRKHFSKGHRGLNIIPFDPLHIKSLVLAKIPDSPVNVEFKFTDVDLAGISKANVLKVSGFTKEASDLVLEIQANLPKVVLTGPYNIDGRVLILPITGHGDSRIEFDDTTAIAKVKCTTVEKDGEIYLNILKIHLDLTPKKMVFSLQNLFNGDKALGENMNKFLNENWMEMYKEMQPLIQEAIGTILVHIANGPFSKIPYRNLFSDS